MSHVSHACFNHLWANDRRRSTEAPQLLLTTQLNSTELGNKRVIEIQIWANKMTNSVARGRQFQISPRSFTLRPTRIEGARVELEIE